MHLLLVPGLNYGFISQYTSDVDPLPSPSRSHFAYMYEDPINHFVGTYVNNTTDFPAELNDKISRWRCVSHGLQLKLLNASDEDDGWWEAIRVKQMANGGDYNLEATSGGNSFFPVPMLADLRNQQLSNDQTYSTGLLRDLYKVQFNCLQKDDEVDFIEMEDPLNVTADAMAMGSLLTGSFAVSGHPDNVEMAKAASQVVPTAYDMVYIRLHCKDQGTGGSRLHYNCMSNQELVYEDGKREARYMTKTESIGSGAMSLHLQGRRANGNAATFVG